MTSNISAMATIYELSQIWYFVVGFMTVDIVLGMLNAWKQGLLDSEESFHGLLKKLGILLVIIFSLIVERSTQVPCFKLTAVFYMVYESTSIIENAGVLGIPLPNALKNAVALLKQTNEEK